MNESAQHQEIEQETPSLEPIDELEQLRRDIARQIRSNQRFLEGFHGENFDDEEE